MRFTLSGLQQDPDDRKANQRTPRITHKDLIATSENTQVQHDVRQNGGDHGKTPDSQACLAVKPQDKPHCGE